MFLQTTVVGSLGGDAIVKKVNDKIAINFSVAHNERYVDRATGVVTEEVTWLNCTIWRKEMTELVSYLKKGQLVHLQGKPAPKVFRDKKGEARVDFALIVHDLKLLGKNTSKEAVSEETEEIEKQE